MYLYPAVYKRLQRLGNLYMRANEDLDRIESTLLASGLTDTAQQFPEDVLAAVQAAERVRASLNLPLDNTLEPWPAMRVWSTSCTG